MALDLHENQDMKKGTLTFERPFQTKSPDSLRRCQRINQNRIPIPGQVAKGYTQGEKKNLEEGK